MGEKQRIANEALYSGGTAGSWKEVARDHWEVFLAAGILIGVLNTLQIVALHDWEMAITCVPILFFVAAAVFHLRFVHVTLWVGTLVFVALLKSDWRYAGAAYPALLLSVLAALHWWWKKG